MERDWTLLEEQLLTNQKYLFMLYESEKSSTCIFICYSSMYYLNYIVGLRLNIQISYGKVEKHMVMTNWIQYNKSIKKYAYF